MDMTIPGVHTASEATSGPSRSKTHHQALQKFHRHQRGTLQKKHLGNPAEVRRPNRRPSHLTRHPRGYLRASCQQSSTGGQSTTSRFPLVNSHAGRRGSGKEMHRVPRVCQQATRASIRAQDNTASLALRPMGARHGGPAEEIITRRAHSPPGCSRQVH